MATTEINTPAPYFDFACTAMHEAFALRAQVRAALALLQADDDYAAKASMCDAGFVLADVDSRLGALASLVDSSSSSYVLDPRRSITAR